MPIFRFADKRILFIHIPKTGGMALARCLADQGEAGFDQPMSIGGRIVRPRHQHAEVLEAIFDADMFEMSFMVTRHPVARIISEYRYQCRKSGPHLAKLIGFSAWLRYVLARARRNPAFRDNHFRAQSEFEAFGCEVFRYEDGLAAPLVAVSAKTGTRFAALPELYNQSPKLAVVPSASDLDLIANVYRADFQRYGYDVNKTATYDAAGEGLHVGKDQE